MPYAISLNAIANSYKTNSTASKFVFLSSISD